MHVPSVDAATKTQALGRSIRPSGYFALVFGQMVGSGWIVILGVWLREAGPGGAVVGFLAGGIAMLLLCAVYCELAARMPSAGGEVLYVERAFGKNAAFMLGWFLTIYYIALSAFEGIALSWLLGELFPTLRGQTLYMLLGQPVTTDGVGIGLAGVLVIGALNFRGAAVSVLVQRVVTYTFLVLCLLLVSVGIGRDRVANLVPLFHGTRGHSWHAGATWIFASCALFVSGFQVICYTIEERHEATSVRRVAMAALLAVVTGTVFYSSIILSAASARPWLELLDQRLPAVSAFKALYPSGRLGVLVLVAATVSLAKTWNSLLVAASRMLFGQARLGFLPVFVGAVHPRYRSPYVAVAIVAAMSFAGILLGRGAVVPILNMGALCVCLTFAACVCALIKLRRIWPARAEFTVPGGTPVILVTLCIVIMMIIELARRSIVETVGHAPVDMLMIAAWALIGFSVLALRKRRNRRIDVQPPADEAVPTEARAVVAARSTSGHRQEFEAPGSSRGDS